MTSSTFFERVRANPYQTASLCVFLTAVYLCLVNLNYAALWHDEAVVAFVGKNLLEQGDIVGWDGRNLVDGKNGHALTDELRDVAPPLQYVLAMAGFAVFGVNESGARIMHAVAGILALGVFYLILRRHLPASPRLTFFIFLFAAWSAQLLLWFRQARYYSVTVLCMMAGIYFYERYWQTRRPLDLAALTLVATLAFFNHYAVGTATMLSLAAMHLLFRARETSGRKWMAFAGCGSIVGAAGLAYLTFVGLIGGDRDPVASFLSEDVGEYHGTLPLFLLRIWVCFRDVFLADWISWPVFLWFAGTLLLIHGRRNRNNRPAGNSSRVGQAKRRKFALGSIPPHPPHVAAVTTLVLTGTLFALFSALFSPQPVWDAQYVDLRYYVPALPLLLAMKGLFAEWVYRYSKLAGGAVVAVLLLTNAGTYPLTPSLPWSGERILGFHLFQFISEIHSPYRDALRTVSDYLLEHAEQDDLVYVTNSFDSEALAVRVGHLVLFCGVLNDDTPLPRATVEKLRTSLYVNECTPDWVVVSGRVSNAYREHISPLYDLVAQPDLHYYPTQRPSIFWHSFQPLSVQDGIAIFRQKAEIDRGGGGGVTLPIISHQYQSRTI